MNSVYLFYTIFQVLLYTGSCWRYDIEEEAQKLYGENLQDVLLKLRRMPEYLTVLGVKISPFHQYLKITTMHYLKNGLESVDVKKIFGESKSATKKSFLRKVTKVINKMVREGNNNLRQADQASDNKSNENETDTNGDDSQEIRHLDYYRGLPRYAILTRGETNEAKDIGFEAIGNVIDNIINHFSSNSGHNETERQEHPKSTHVGLEVIKTTPYLGLYKTKADLEHSKTWTNPKGSEEDDDKTNDLESSKFWNNPQGSEENDDNSHSTKQTYLRNQINEVNESSPRYFFGEYKDGGNKKRDVRSDPLGSLWIDRWLLMNMNNPGFKSSQNVGAKEALEKIIAQNYKRDKSGDDILLKLWLMHNTGVVTSKGRRRIFEGNKTDIDVNSGRKEYQTTPQSASG